MIQFNTKPVIDEIKLICDDVTTINFILSLYPNRNLKFMSGPLEFDHNRKSIEATSVNSRYKPLDIQMADDIYELSNDVKSVLDEFFEIIGDDKEVYLYAVVISCHGCRVQAHYS